MEEVIASDDSTVRDELGQHLIGTADRGISHSAETEQCPRLACGFSPMDAE